jgi:hypothetical protein
MNHQPEIASNRAGDTVAAALTAYWQHRIDGFIWDAAATA